MRCAHAVSLKINSALYAAAAAASSEIKPSLETQDIKFNWDEVERIKDLMKTYGRYVYLNPSAGTAESVAKRTILFRTINIAITI